MAILPGGSYMLFELIEVRISHVAPLDAAAYILVSALAYRLGCGLLAMLLAEQSASSPVSAPSDRRNAFVVWVLPAVLSVPCWLRVDPWFSGLPVAAVLVAAWSAARYGTQALPALCVGFLPLLLLTIDLGYGITIRSLSGYALAGLVVGRFVADPTWRNRVLSTHRLSVAVMAREAEQRAM